MDEFLVPKEVSTGMDVLPGEDFSEPGLEVSFTPLASLADLVAWKEKQDSRRKEEKEQSTNSNNSKPRSWSTSSKDYA